MQIIEESFNLIISVYKNVWKRFDGSHNIRIMIKVVTKVINKMCKD